MNALITQDLEPKDLDRRQVRSALAAVRRHFEGDLGDEMGLNGISVPLGDFMLAICNELELTNLEIVEVVGAQHAVNCVFAALYAVLEEDGGTAEWEWEHGDQPFTFPTFRVAP